MRPVRVALAALLALAAGRSAAAHDFWIEPSSFRPAVGATVSVRLFVGPNFEGEPFPRVPQLLSKFVLTSASAAGERAIPGRPGDDPAGAIRVDEPGLQLLGYRSLDYTATIDGAKFEEYLKEEGLEKIAALRASRGQTGAPAREAFSRCAKALLDAPPGGATGFDRSLGFTLEIVPEANPYALAAGRELPVRLLLDGKPLEGSLVQALRHGDPGSRVSARTDRNGRAKLRISAAGFWLVKAVEMHPAPPGVAADWQSLWASLTFDNGAPNTVGKAP